MRSGLRLSGYNIAVFDPIESFLSGGAIERGS